MKKVTKLDRTGLVRVAFDVDKKTRKALEQLQAKKGDVALKELFLKAVGIKVN